MLWIIPCLLWSSNATSFTAFSTGDSPKHRERSSIYVLWNDQRSHLCYALHRVRVCLLSFLHFSAMRFASLYRRERPLFWEWKASASDRKDSPSRVRAKLLENGEIISERRTNDDPILKEKEESVFFEDRGTEFRTMLPFGRSLLQRESLLRVSGEERSPEILISFHSSGSTSNQWRKL